MHINGEPGGIRGVVAIGASAGGVEAMTNLAAGLSAELPYAYLMVLHIPARAPSVLAHIVDRAGPLPATAAEDGAPLEAGHIYVAVPDRHLLVNDHRQMLTRGPTENGHRPAINALFRSAALAYGSRAVGVLLSGVLDDGVLGMAVIQSRGGTTISQDPADCLFSAMPSKALEQGVADHQAAAGDIGALLAKLQARDIEERDMEPDHRMEMENRIAMTHRFSTEFDSQDLGLPSGYTCPDCNGSLIALGENNFRCHVGHAWTPDSLLNARDNEIEGALWIAVRSLQEKAKLARQLAEKVGHGMLFDRYTAMAAETEQALGVLSERLANSVPVAGDSGG